MSDPLQAPLQKAESWWSANKGKRWLVFIGIGAVVALALAKCVGW
jgi:hypothetical protein